MPTTPPPLRPYPRAAIILLGLGGFIAVAFGLWAIRSIAAPVLLALVVVICVNPIRSALERRGVPRGLATGSVIGVTFVLLAAFAGSLVIAVAQFSTLLPQFAPQIQQLATDAGDVLEQIGIGAEQVRDLINGFDPTRIVSIASGLVGSATGLVVGLVIVLTTLLLMAMDAAYIPTLMKKIAPSRPLFVSALANFAAGVRRYMVVTTGLGIAQGLLNWIALLIMQVPGAFLWGLLSFLCSFIPNVGYFIAIIPPLVFGLLTGGVPTLVAIVLVYGVINALVQTVIQPRVVGDAVSLNQTLTFISVLFWALILGPLGAILAIPLTLLVRAVLIDADPNARWWRPLTGDIDEVRNEMRTEDAATKAAKQSRRRIRQGAEKQG